MSVTVVTTTTEPRAGSSRRARRTSGTVAPIDVHLFQDLRSGLRVQVLRDEMALIDAELMKCRGAVCFVKRGDGSSSLPGGAFLEEPLDSLNRHHGPVGVPAGGRRGVSHGAFEATWAGKAREGRNSIANPLGRDEKPKKRERTERPLPFVALCEEIR